MLVLPPGGAWSRVVERSVMKLPQFWFEPSANLLLEVPGLTAAGAAAAAEAFCLVASRRGAAAAGAGAAGLGAAALGAGARLGAGAS